MPAMGLCSCEFWLRSVGCRVNGPAWRNGKTVDKSSGPIFFFLSLDHLPFFANGCLY